MDERQRVNSLLLPHQPGVTKEADRRGTQVGTQALQSLVRGGGTVNLLLFPVFQGFTQV